MSIENKLADLKIDHYIKTAIDIANYFDDQEEREQLLNDLSNIVELNCKLKEKLKHVPMKSQEIIDEYVSLDDDKINYEQAAKKLTSELDSFEPDLSRNHEFKQFKGKVRTLYKGAGDEDEDFAITEEDVTVTDPFTKKRIQEPVKNKCGHVYDLATVTAVVQKNRHTRCPVMGCKSKDYIVLTDLSIDVITKAHLKKHPA